MEPGSRQPPPQGPPPSYAFVTRVYRKSLRPVVIFTSSIAALYALFACIGNFRNGTSNHGQTTAKLATFSTVLGVLYIVICAIEVLGLASAATRRLQLIRIYALLSGVVILLVLASGLLRTVIHFTMKDDIISECTNLTKDDTFVSYPFGFFGPARHSVVDEADANRWCQNAWDHDSWAEIVSLLILLFLSGLWTSIAFSYYRQVLDPTSPANVSRVPAPQDWASHYNPPYSGPYGGRPYYGQQPYGPPQYVPPPGPPQQQYGPPPGPPPPPGYAGGDGVAGGAYKKQLEEKDNPFADFDQPAHSSNQRL
ncbi:hypothetical protein E1B28_006698 [Marasmius oreades]|uniref:Transmembrane protein n=1 Tax=Marasmius oreades TaxID=181124 RepID=A0A9P8AB42_9AGAR|nr:uncharacterized protein E1B28_006698 [Marasmius oreades]KAG7096015.1 hypothetical protein E1B28_006698 [Marasmius oreades]